MALLLAELVHGHDVRMTKLCAGLGLSEEPRLQIIGGLDVGGDDLKGDHTIERGSWAL